MCSTHEQYATPERPAARALLGVVERDQGAARGTSWAVLGTGNAVNTPSHD